MVRVCEPTYNKEVLVNAGVAVHDWPFPDGGVPPKAVVQNWLQLVDDRFGNLAEGGREVKTGQPPTIAVHCVAGLGRAPVLVAIALIEAGMSPLDAVEFVRKYRRGAFNSVQIGYLDSYKRGSFSSSLRKLRMPAAGSSKDLSSTVSSTTTSSSGASGFFNSIKRVPSPMDERTAARRGSPSPTGDSPGNTSAPAGSTNGYGTAVPSNAQSAPPAAAASKGGFGSFFKSFGKKSGSPTPPPAPGNPPSPPASGSAASSNPVVPVS